MSIKARRLLGIAGAIFASTVTPALAGDAPPEGTRSLFDFAFTQVINGKLAYNIPTSLSDLVTRLKQIEGSTPVVVPIPLGRSVQRFDTDLIDPRLVATITADLDRPATGPLQLRLANRLFVGYGRKADQLEVISYNERAGRFEFQIVKNFSKPGQQEVLYAPRNFCNKCHYHEVPMFPRNPWQETTAFPATADAVLRARTAAGDSSDHYLGMPISVDNSVGYAFDRAADNGAFVIAYQHMWQQGCGAMSNPTASDASDGPNCRSLMLKVAMRTMFRFFQVPAGDPLYASLGQIFVKNAKTAFGDQFFFPISDLRARNPLDSTGGFTGNQRAPLPTLSTDSNTINILKQNSNIPAPFDPLNSSVPAEDPFMFAPGRAGGQTTYSYPDYLAIDDIPKIKPTTDPATLNSFITWLATELRIDKNFWRQFYQTGSTPFAALDQIIDQLPPASLGASPFFEDDLVASVAQAKGIAGPTGHYDPSIQLNDANTAQTDLSNNADPGMTDVQSAAMGNFKRICGGCHNSGAGNLGFVTGHISDLKSRAPKILQRLYWERCTPPAGHSQMPPSGHRDVICGGDDADRQNMLQFAADLVGLSLDDDNICGGPATTLPQPNPQARAHLCSKH